MISEQYLLTYKPSGEQRMLTLNEAQPTLERVLRLDHSFTPQDQGTMRPFVLYSTRRKFIEAMAKGLAAAESPSWRIERITQAGRRAVNAPSLEDMLAHLYADGWECKLWMQGQSSGQRYYTAAVWKPDALGGGGRCQDVSPVMALVAALADARKRRHKRLSNQRRRKEKSDEQ